MPHIDLDNPSEGHKQVHGVNQIEINGTWRVATKEEVEDAGALIYPAVMSPTDLLLEIFGGGDEESKKAPDGWFISQAAAAIDAETSGLYQPYWEETPQSGMETVYPYDIIRNGLYFTHVSKNVAATADARFSLAVSPEDGNTYAIDMANPTKPKTKADIVFEAANVPDPGAVPINEQPIPLGNGKFMTFYAVTDEAGHTTRQSVVSEKERGAPTSDDIIKFSEAQGGGRLIPVGDGRYTYEPEPDAPFQASPLDVVALPSQGGSLIKTSENQYQFVRDTFDPGRKVDATGREYLQQIDGRWTELAPRFEPELIRANGMNLFQQRSGQVSQLSTATMDDIITQALIDGDIDKAFAFQDFRDRPTAQETFDTALEFARSPADQRIISSIARGITPVQPPPEGTIQRVGPQPDFLVEAYQDFQRRTQAGRAPTDEEASTLSARAAAGQSPLTDTLQSRLEELKIENQQLKNDAISLKTQQDQQVFQQNNPTLFGGEDPGLTQFKLDLGLSSGSNMPESTKKTLQDLIAALPEQQRQYGMTQVESIYNGELTAEQVIGNLRMFADPSKLTVQGQKPPTVGATGLDILGLDPNASAWERSIAAFPDLTSDTFQALGSKDITSLISMPGINATPEEVDQYWATLSKHINSIAATPAGEGQNMSSVRDRVNWADSTYNPTLILDREGKEVPIGWETPEQRTTREFNEKLQNVTGDPNITLQSIESGADAFSGTAGSTDLGGYGSTQVSSSPASTSTVGVNNPLNLTPNTPPLTNTPLASTNIEPTTAPVASTAGKSLGTATNMEDFNALVAAASANQKSKPEVGYMPPEGGFRRRAGGGTVQPGEITVVGEQGPEIAMMPPGTHILPLGKATKRDIKAAQATGRAYQQGGIVFGDLAPGLQQLQRGRPITPPRGYLFQQGGLTLPSMQALQNLTPTVRESFYGMHGDIGISPADFRQELQTAAPGGTRLPTSRMLPLGRRGVR
jgi:hypothetical protein